jgi:hypothetical protein
MEDFEVKPILTSKLHMMKQLLSDNCKREEFGIQKFEVGVSWALAKSKYVFTPSSNVWAQLANLSAQSIEILIQSTNVLTQLADVLT